MPVVIASGKGHTVVVDRIRNVATVTEAGAVVRIQDRKIAELVTKNTRTVAVAAPGPQGRKGIAGLDSSGAVPAYTFAFGDATPATVLTPAVASEITQVSLQIEQVFDGVGAQIQLGTSASPGLLMDITQNDPSALMTFEVSPRQQLAAGTPIILTITPGAGASQGLGQFVITAVPAV